MAEAEKDPATMPVDDLDTVEQVEAAMNAPGVSKTRKQKLKQRLKALQVRRCVCNGGVNMYCTSLALICSDCYIWG